VVFLDFTKAFDRVDHTLLLNKLPTFGIRGEVLDWVSDYLKDRHFRVRVNGVFSKDRRAPTGVPQCSILGPLLFTLFINDLPSVVTSLLELYADDAKLYRVISSPEDPIIMQEGLDSMTDWTRNNNLPFNESKCKVLHIRHNPTYTYSINGAILPSVESEKDLGTIISKDLSPTAN
jgi:ribonuclease P/MRP protein subunit RPP40